MTKRRFLEQFGLETLRDLPDIEAMEDAGLLESARFDAYDLPSVSKEGE